MLEEEKRTTQLKREIEEERQLQDMQRMQEEAGGKKKVQKLDWMYASGPSASLTLKSDQEDYLLGRKKAIDLIKTDASGSLKVCTMVYFL